MNIDAARRWTAVIVLLSAAVMLADYARNRSLWLDEAFIALNVAERSYLVLADPLAYAQRAPRGFLCTLRALTDLFGNSEYLLRLATTRALGATWLASFALRWVFHLRHAFESPFMREFWQRFFAPSVLDWIGLKRRFVFKYFDYFSFTPWEYLSLGVAAFGALILWRTQRAPLAIIRITGLALITASTLEFHPIHERLLIFLAAPTAIMIGCGAGAAIIAAAATRPR
jgi:hypothetical protein